MRRYLPFTSLALAKLPLTKLTLTALFSALFTSLAFSAQDWTDSQNRTISAEFTSLEIADNQPTGIHVIFNNKTIFITWDKLSAASQKQAQELQIKKLDSQSSIFDLVVYPILNSNCNGCHGDRKQKGDLRTDSYANLLKGGDEGAALVPNDSKKSTLIKRILLDRADDDVMPPQKKSPLDKLEIEFLTWWVENGGSDKTLTTELPEKFKSLMAE